MAFLSTILCFFFVLLVKAEDAILFKGSSASPPPSLLFTSEDGSNISARSINPLYAVAATLRPRQSRCPYPVMCSPRTCCPANTKCCGTGMKCCPTDSNCVTSPPAPIDGCCPYSAVTCGGTACAEAGSTCCGTSVCPPGTVCNMNGGTPSCCKPGEVQCLGTCCPSGSTCSTTPGMCDRLQIRRSTEQSTATSTQISTRTSTSSSSSTPSACPIQKRQSRLPNCSYECHNGKWLPVIEIPNIAGQTDQLFISMCSGILSTSNKRTSRGGDGQSFDILEYGGDGKRKKRERRRKAKCANFCSEQKRIFKDPARLECDEYPPAMSLDGGDDAHRTCIPADQNSGEQGRRFSDFINKCKPPAGSSIVVRMKGGCTLRKRSSEEDAPLALPAPLEQRQSEPEQSATAFDASGSQVRNDGNSSFIYIPFQDLRNGKYTVSLEFEGIVKGFSILDSDGEVYHTETTGPTVKKTFEFDVDEVDDDEPLPAALIVDAEKNGEVRYKGTAVLSNGTGEGRPRSGGVRGYGGEIGVVVVWGVSVVVGLWMGE